ncbi:Uncharacterised protein [Mycobacteroides abscessus subsp. abscessus]|nr:Uncharacterised protein [Mycobacteroides abscessus subsp. abscessus]
MIFEELTGRRLLMADSYAAVGLRKSQYNNLSWEELTHATRLRLAADTLGVNYVALLVKCGQLAPREAVDYVDERRRELMEFFPGDSDFGQAARKGVTQTTTRKPAPAKSARTKIRELKPRREAPGM